MLDDPNQAAQAEAKMEHMVKVGNDKIKKTATSAMEDAMESMNDPKVMAEMSKMLKDPNFKAQLEAMAKDPSFQVYMDAMQDMVKDPSKKKKLESVTDSIRASL